MKSCGLRASAAISRELAKCVLFREKTAARFDTRLIRIADAALRQIDDVIARAISRYGKARVAVCVGSCDNGTELSFAAHKQFVESGAFPTGYSLEMQGADYPASFIAEKYGVQGAALAFSTACSSSAVAIIKAAELIQGGCSVLIRLKLFLPK